MQSFASGRDAKEFLIGAIIDEAQREGVSLSDVERKMLYFSETAWTLPDIAEVNDAFDREYDQASYEQKIGALIRNLRAGFAGSNQPDASAWKDALRILSKEDHYLLVLIASAGESYRQKGGFLKLLLSALAIVTAVPLVLAYVIR